MVLIVHQIITLISLAFGEITHEIMSNCSLGLQHPYSGPGGGLVVIGGYKGYNKMHHKQHKCTPSNLTDSRAPSRALSRASRRSR